MTGSRLPAGGGPRSPMVRYLACWLCRILCWLAASGLLALCAEWILGHPTMSPDWTIAFLRESRGTIVMLAFVTIAVVLLVLWLAAAALAFSWRRLGPSRTAAILAAVAAMAGVLGALLHLS